MKIKNIEIIIPTWNRDKYLDRTLSQFAESPFVNNDITIIDNASPDKTQDICEKYISKFPNLKIIRNNKNIGGPANILRSFEFAKEKYLWFVGDNDNYDFSDCDEIIDIIENSDFDLIIIENVTKAKDLRMTEVHELFDKGYGNDFIQQIATLGTYIFKTELYTSECLQEGYDIVKYLYPQLAFAKKACEDNFSVYISDKKMRIGEKNPNLPFNTLDLVNSWVSSLLIFEKKYRNEGLRYYFGDTPIIVASIGSVIAVKSRKQPYRKALNNLLISFIRAKGIVGLFYAILTFLSSLIPSKLCKFILNKFYDKHEK